MKKILLSAFICSLLITAASAQTVHLGIKGGLNMDKVQGQSFKDGYYSGFQLGGFLDIGLTKTIGVQPEVLFNQSNTKYHSSSDVVIQASDGSNIHMNYLSIPVLLNINAAKILTIQAGPQFSILMNPHETVLENGQDAFKSGNFALAAGVRLNLGALQVYGRYNIGLSNISDATNSDNWKSQQLQLGIGLKLL
ncbi:MAG TPA: porin family protein [Chitinophagaceae bacterium]|nr:porin family protein [Chitinophagaceae bacterium]